jgi:uncharacterized pyridoxamine 5'-phosphate oxidase family protein
MYWRKYQMIDFVSILKENPVGVLATQDGEKVRTRIFLFLFAEGKRAYFCTEPEKPVYQQLQINPEVSFCTHAEDFSPVLSINGKAVFTNDMSLKKRALRTQPLHDFFQTPDNPHLILFYIDIESIDTFTFAGGTDRYFL